jgi:hypothetical protein
MRPVGPERLALLRAAEQLATQDKGPTLRELAQAACVGYQKALVTVKDMTRAGDLVKPRERRVAYRNKPVAEYAPAKRDQLVEREIDVASVFAVWANL